VFVETIDALSTHIETTEDLATISHEVVGEQGVNLVATTVIRANEVVVLMSIAVLGEKMLRMKRTESLEDLLPG